MGEEISAVRRGPSEAVLLLILVFSSAVLAPSFHGCLALASAIASPRKSSFSLPVKQDLVISSLPCPSADARHSFLQSAPPPIDKLLPYTPSQNAPSLSPNIDEIGVSKGSAHLEMPDCVMPPLAVTTKPVMKSVQQLIPSLAPGTSFHYIGVKTSSFPQISPSMPPDGNLGLIDKRKAPISEVLAQSPASKDIGQLPSVVLAMTLAPFLQRIVQSLPPDVTMKNTPLRTAAPPSKALTLGDVLSSSSMPPPIPNDGRNHDMPARSHTASQGSAISKQAPPSLVPKTPLRLSETQPAASVAPSLGLFVPIASVPHTSPDIYWQQHNGPTPIPPKVVSDHTGSPSIHQQGPVASQPWMPPANQRNQHSGPTSSHSWPPSIQPRGESPSPMDVVSVPPSLSSEPHVSAQINGPSSAPSSSLPSLFPVVTPVPERITMSPQASIAPSPPKVHQKQIVTESLSGPVASQPWTSPANQRSRHSSPTLASTRVILEHSWAPTIHLRGWDASPPWNSPAMNWRPYTSPAPAPPRVVPYESPSPMGVVSMPPSLSSEPHVLSQINGHSSTPSSSLPLPFPVVAPAPEGITLSPHASIAPSTPKVHKKRIVNDIPSPPPYSFSPPHGKGTFISPTPQTPSDLGKELASPQVQPPVWRRHKQHAAPPVYRGVSRSPAQPRLPSMKTPTAPLGVYPPKISPSPSHSKPIKPVLPLPARVFPSPPPNRDCEQYACSEQYTNTPPGSPCGCVLPIQVGLRLDVALYTFFPLVSEFASEVASGVNMNVSQVRIMGANADSQQQDKTIVNVDLVPMTERFDPDASLLVYQKFWHKMVAIDTDSFADYEILYVRYPGLPPSPPSAGSDIAPNEKPFIPGNSSQIFKPLGVDVSKHRTKLGGSLIAIIAISSATALFLCLGLLWFFIFKCSDTSRKSESLPCCMTSTLAKPSGSPLSGRRPSSVTLSFGSSIEPYTGSAKTFTLSEMVRATDNFNPARILGEGGFGRVYSGVLDDGTKVAVKVLKRDDQQGGREFLAEVEILSRLHHRNLVKLIGICTEEHKRCLVYELVPNSSVESHLHGVDKEVSPLDWGTRMKIALGAARGLAYLHEDSSPNVIHRDFKSSNILLEDDFTPKVSDFGLARAAVEEGNELISTRVMGTFGYVAPEYAMTGHLLVKSDVYSYGVVLLELLSGRKPVDMSQPQGQENLVTWARPLLTSKEGLEMIVDPLLSSSPFDSVAKVAAIASMCVQPEVSHRPFMGEVVQALKLVCNDADEKLGGSGSFSQERFFLCDMDIDTSFADSVHRAQASSSVDYDHNLETGKPLSVSGLLSSSAGFGQPMSTSFRWSSSSGPLRTKRKQPFWQRLGELSGGTVSEHGVAL